MTEEEKKLRKDSESTCSTYGYEVGDLFTLTELADNTYPKGSLLELIEDDKTNSPYFGDVLEENNVKAMYLGEVQKVALTDTKKEYIARHKLLMLLNKGNC